MKKIILLVGLTIISGCNHDTVPAFVLKPVKVCGDIEVPIYGILDRPASSAEVLGAAAIGGVIGNQIGDGDGKDVATILGTIIGAATQSNSRKREPVIVDYKTEYKCRIEYK
jgi:uncharacterized protein YcfJ